LALYLVDSAKEIMESDPKKALENYEESAKLFENEGCALQAAKSYFSLKKYEKAKVFFVNAHNFAEARECLMKMVSQNQDQEGKQKNKELYEEAMNYFDKANKHAKAIECCELIPDFKMMVKLLKKYESFIANFISMLEENLKKYIKELEANMIRLSIYFYQKN